MPWFLVGLLTGGITGVVIGGFFVWVFLTPAGATFSGSRIVVQRDETGHIVRLGAG